MDNGADTDNQVDNIFQYGNAAEEQVDQVKVHGKELAKTDQSPF